MLHILYTLLFSLFYLFLLSSIFVFVGVKTTRALSVIGTGQTIRRPWYSVNSKEMIECGGKKLTRFAPNQMLTEPGTVRLTFLQVTSFHFRPCSILCLSFFYASSSFSFLSNFS